MCVYLDVYINGFFVCTTPPFLSAPAAPFGSSGRGEPASLLSVDVTSVSTPGAACREDVWRYVTIYVYPPHPPFLFLIAIGTCPAC